MRHHSGLLAGPGAICVYWTIVIHVAAAIYYGSYLPVSIGTRLFVFGHVSIQTAILDAVGLLYATATLEVTACTLSGQSTLTSSNSPPS